MAPDCRTCATTPPPRARWCGHCGAALTRGSPAAAGDRTTPPSRAARTRTAAGLAVLLAAAAVVVAQAPSTRSPADGRDGWDVDVSVPAAGPAAPGPVARPGGLWSGERPAPPGIGTPVTVAPCRSATGAGTVAVGCVSWAVALPPGIDRTAWSRHDTTLVAAGTTGDVVAVDLRNGSLRWSTTVGSGSVTPAATTSGSAPLALGDGSVLGLDIASGEVRWRDIGSRGRSSRVEVTSIGPWTAISDGRTLRLLDWTTGLVQWRRDLAGDEASVLTPAGLFNLVGGRIEALESTSGRTAWTAQVAADVVPTIHTTPDLVVAADRSGRIHALDRRTGASRWTAAGPTQPVAAAAISAGADDRSLLVRVFGGPDGERAWYVAVLDAATGTPRLTAPLHAPRDPLAATVVIGDLLVVARSTAEGGVVTARELPGGTVRWEVATGRPEAASMVGDLVLVSTDSGLSALDPSDGQLVWHLPVPGPQLVSSDPLVILVRSTLIGLDPAGAAPTGTALGR